MLYFDINFVTNVAIGLFLL